MNPGCMEMPQKRKLKSLANIYIYICVCDCVYIYIPCINIVYNVIARLAPSWFPSISSFWNIAFIKFRLSWSGLKASLTKWVVSTDASLKNTKPLGVLLQVQDFIPQGIQPHSMRNMRIIVQIADQTRPPMDITKSNHADHAIACLERASQIDLQRSSENAHGASSHQLGGSGPSETGTPGPTSFMSRVLPGPQRKWINESLRMCCWFQLLT